MIEAAPSQLPEEEFIKALEFGHNAIRQHHRDRGTRTLAGKPKSEFPLVGARPSRAPSSKERRADERLVEAIFGKERPSVRSPSRC
jgi:polyribonucleotide nucleotidyltransferase